jgi:GA4 desaturase
VARPILDAEDRKAAGEDIKVPRYAGYSVWVRLLLEPHIPRSACKLTYTQRPLKIVKRDPLAVCDWRTLDESDIIRTENRKPSDVNTSGSYLGEAVGGLPPKRPETQRWYWSPNQEPNEITIIKFADTASEEDGNIAGGCLHCSPILPGTDDEEPRSSVETRVYLFWE